MAIFNNQASLSYGGTITNSNVTTGEILDGLTMTKTAASSDYGQGDGLTYVVSIVNSGATDYTALTLTDTLGAYTLTNGTTVYPLGYVDGSLLYYQNGVLTAAPTVTQGPPLSITGITVPARGNATLIYEARTNAYAPLSQGSEITNTATVAGAALTEPISDTSTVSTRDEAQLTIAKSVSPLTVTNEDEITYTFVIQNSGNTATETVNGVVITDTFTPILSAITVTLDGATLAVGTGYTYDATTGLFQTVSGVITVPAATYTTDESTGIITTTPGVTVLTVSGTV